MATAQKLDIKNRLLTGNSALGNSNRGLKEVCSDLLNDFGRGKKEMKQLSEGTFLCRQTIERMMDLTETEEGHQYRPNADTCERILRFFGAQMTFDQVRIQNRYANKPKEER